VTETNVATRGRSGSRNSRIALVVFGVAALALLAWVTGWWESHHTIFAQVMVSGLLIGSVYSLVSMGLSLVFGVLDIINFAHGALMSVAMYVAFVLARSYGVDPYLSLLVTIPLMFIIGVFVQATIINPVMDAPLHSQLLLTLGLSLFIQNLLLVLFTGTPRSIELPYASGSLGLGLVTLDFPFRLFGAVVTLPKAIAFIVSLLLAGALFLLLQRTRLGTAIRAAAQDPEGAELVGIDVRRVYLVTFGIGAASVGAAGSLILPFFFVSPTAGETFNIIAFVVVVLGGMGSIRGALAGGFLIGLTQELTQLFVPGSSKLIGVFALFILVLLLRPEGLFGSRT